MIILGIILLIVGLLVAKLAFLVIVGIVVLCVGLLLLLLGSSGHAVGGRRWYW